MGFIAKGSGYVVPIDDDLENALCDAFRTTDEGLPNCISPGDVESVDNVSSVTLDGYDGEIGSCGIWYIRTGGRDGQLEGEIEEDFGIDVSGFYADAFEIDLVQ